MFQPGDRVRVKPEVVKAEGFEYYSKPGRVSYLGTRVDYPVWVLFEGYEDLEEFGFEENELDSEPETD